MALTNKVNFGVNYSERRITLLQGNGNKSQRIKAPMSNVTSTLPFPCTSRQQQPKKIILLHTCITRKSCADFTFTAILRPRATIVNISLWFVHAASGFLQIQYQETFLKLAARQKKITPEKCRRRTLLEAFEGIWLFCFVFFLLRCCMPLENRKDAWHSVKLLNNYENRILEVV